RPAADGVLAAATRRRGVGRGLGRRRAPRRRPHRTPAPQARRRPGRAEVHPDGARHRVPDGGGLMARPRLGLAGRLFAAQSIVVFAGAVPLGVIAAAVGPAIFHRHLAQVSGHVDAQTTRHVEEAYASANLISLAVALLAALAAALAVSAY